MSLVEKIRADILKGKLLPGSELSQTVLAAAYGVSRIPVRDALQALASEKLVELVPGRGARVVSLTAEQLHEIYDLRILLECDLLEKAMAKADATSFADVDYALQKSSIEAGRPGWEAGDWLFHRTLYRPSGRPRQLAMIEELRSICVLYAPKYDDLVAQTPLWVSDHQFLAEAYKAGRVEEACSRLRRHIAAADAYLAL